MDFKNNTQDTKTFSPVQMLQIMALNARQECLNRIFDYNRRKNKTGQANSYLVRTSLQNLYLCLKSTMYNWLKKEEIEELELKINNKDVEENLEAFDIIDFWLYKKGLLKMDTGIDYDTTNPAIEDLIKGV